MCACIWVLLDIDIENVEILTDGIVQVMCECVSVSVSVFVFRYI